MLKLVPLCWPCLGTDPRLCCIEDGRAHSSEMDVIRFLPFKAASERHMYFTAKKELAEEQANECNCGASGVQNRTDSFDSSPCYNIPNALKFVH